MIKIIVNVGSKKYDRKDDLSPKLIHIQNTLVMRTVDTLDNDVSHGEGKPATRKVYMYLIKSSPTFLHVQ